MKARENICPGPCEPTPAYPAAKHPERCKLFYCVNCRRYQPWCCGAAPGNVCDDCAMVASKAAS